MSYDYYLQAHFNKGFQNVPTQQIVQSFGKYIVKKHDDYIELQLDENNSCTVFISMNEPFTDSISIHRPCSDYRLIECIYSLMQLGNFIFFESDGKHPIVLKEETINHLPADMIDTLGEPVIARDWESFLALYKNNR